MDTGSTALHGDDRHWRRWVVPLAMLLLLVAAGFALRHELRATSYRAILKAMRAVPLAHIWLSLLGTIGCYLVLPWHDVLGLRYAKKPIPLGRSFVTSFMAYAFTQSLGFSAITGGSIRLRFWTIAGLSTSDVARAAAFSAVGFWVGILTTCGLALLLEPLPPEVLGYVPFRSVAPLGAFGLACVVGYMVFAAVRREPIVIRSWELDPPRLSLAVSQFVVATVDWALAAYVAWVLLPPAKGLTFVGFLGLFVMAQAIGLISHVPGGLGVFETLMVLMLERFLPADVIVGSLLVYRVVYYLVPFIIAALLLAVLVAREQSNALATAVRATVKAASRWGPTFLPTILSAATFVSGVVLLFSGATPSERGRMAFLGRVLPLGVIELSHLTGSLLGTGMLVLAWALRRRIDAAWVLTVAALSAGIGVSLLRGLEWEEALVLAVVLAVLIPSRSAFHRRAALTAEPLEPEWILAIFAVLAASTTIGLFAYRHVEYANELWWQFGRHADAPRFLRATVAAGGSVLVLALIRLLRSAPVEPGLPSETELARAALVVRRSADTRGNLALLGDKALLMDDQATAMLMYGVEGRSWVALGDPLGDEEAGNELAWRFHELADRHGGWPVFYEVGSDRLPLYIDLGLSLLKLGEEAFVPLQGFSLEGANRKGLRRALRDAEKKQVQFEVVPVESVPAMFPELRRISDAWLTEKNVREKGFSLGRYDERYLAHHPVALVRLNERPVAFANLWLGDGHSELSIDLMRWTPDAPQGMMDYLFIQLMQWGSAQGYERFSLGMAPLSGLENRALAPLWTKAGAFVFRFGEHFYNFRGLRQYKDKFDPKWEPRYLASHGGLALPRILTNVATLISGGLGGIVRK